MKLCSCQRTRLRLALTAKMKPDGILAFESLILAALEDGCVCPVQASEYDEAKANSTILGRPDNSSCSEIPNNSTMADSPQLKDCGCLMSVRCKCSTPCKDHQWVEETRADMDSISFFDVCWKCKKERPTSVKVDKQPQSPCDHNNPGKIWSYWTEGSMTVYGCQKCGLVTCKNPNE